MWLFLALTVVLGYFLGNFNGAVFVSHFFGDDVRQHGSGNAGLTNFIRSYGTSRSILVVLIDGGKAVVACVAGGLLLNRYLGFQAGSAIGGVCVILGHVFPVLLGFRGGKGIFSGLFVAIVTDWRIALIILAVFAIAYFTTKYVSLGSVLAAVSFSVSFALLHYNNAVTMICGMLTGLLAVYMHKGNIIRLIKGTERKTDLFKLKKK